MEIIVGTVFNTKHETGCVAFERPNDDGFFAGADSKGRLFRTFNVTDVVEIVAPSTTDIHYLSATSINTSAGQLSIAFCGQLFDYGIQKGRFIVANYAPSTKVTCQRCLSEYHKIYPNS